RGERDGAPHGSSEPRRARVPRSRPLRRPPQDRPPRRLRLRGALLPGRLPGQARGPHRPRRSAATVPDVGGRLGQRRAGPNLDRPRLGAPPGHHVLRSVVSDFDATDFFTDQTLIADPYPYFDGLRERCPVQREPHHDVVMVTGYDEAMAVYHDTERFSSCNSVSGPFPGFPVPLEGDD